MYKENILKTKSKDFAVRTINLYKYLTSEKNEYILSKQILRCGTSIGANVAESECAISKKDFLSKIYISLKECNETLYWLELLVKTKYINDFEFESLSNDCIELRRILTAITKTANSTNSK